MSKTRIKGKCIDKQTFRHLDNKVLLPANIRLLQNLRHKGYRKSRYPFLG